MEDDTPTLQNTQKKILNSIATFKTATSKSITSRKQREKLQKAIEKSTNDLAKLDADNYDSATNFMIRAFKSAREIQEARGDTNQRYELKEIYESPLQSLFVWGILYCTGNLTFVQNLNQFVVHKFTKIPQIRSLEEVLELDWMASKKKGKVRPGIFDDEPAQKQQRLNGRMVFDTASLPP